MAARIRYAGTPGAGNLYLAIEQLGVAGSYYDFASGTFRTSGWSAQTTVVAENPIGSGRWPYTLASTPVATWPDGDYVAEFRDNSGVVQPAGLLRVTMANGDDQPTLAAVAAAIWRDLATGADFGVANSIGLLISTNLNATITSRLASGGAIVLAANGLDAVAIEVGVNARQALSAILADAIGNISESVAGATATTTIYAGGDATNSHPRIVMQESGGLRTLASLTLPS